MDRSGSQWVQWDQKHPGQISWLVQFAHWFLGFWGKSSFSGENQVEACETAHPCIQDSKSKPNLPSRGLREIIATFLGLTHARVVVPNMSIFNSISLTLTKIRQMLVEDDHRSHTLNQLETPIEAVLPDVVSLLKQVDLASGIWYTATDLLSWDRFFSPHISEGRI